jgi:hypothetical protein
MSDLSWPELYADLIPPGSFRILEKLDFAPEARVTLERTYFWLGETQDAGLAIWLDFRRSPIREIRLMLPMPSDEIAKLKDKIRNTALGTGPALLHASTGGTKGILRIQVETSHEISMEWSEDPADSWSEIFRIIDEVREKILTSPHRVAIPARSFPSPPIEWRFPD